MREMVARGHYREAVEVAARRAERRPGDERAADDHKLASIAWLLDRGRAMTFNGRDEEALELFEQAVAIDPESVAARTWLGKTRQKLAIIWHDLARELHADENLHGALEAYENSLAYVPDNPAAREGAAKILLLLNYRQGLGEDYYNEGMRALHEYWLEVARSRFHYSDKYLEEDAQSLMRLQEVERMLAQQSLAVARTLEDQGYYAAAENESRLALLLDPDNEAAEEALRRAGIEAKAERLLGAARMAILRDELDAARELIREGRGLTQTQADEFDSLLLDIDDAAAQRLYERALDLERDFRYEEAILAYEQLLEEQEWFDDARTRLDTLREYVAKAEELYELAARAESPDERRGYLEQIDSFWSGYRDVDQQLRQLEP